MTTPTQAITPIPMSPPVQRCATERKLYLPYSSLCLDRDKIHASRSFRTSVNVQWFIVGRNEPISPYQSVIQRYTFLNPHMRTRAEATVDEFFREEEFHQLAVYMRERRYDIRTTMQFTPVPHIKPDDATRVGTLRPYTNRKYEKQTPLSICRLSDEEEYSLPFTVWGAYIKETP